MKRLLPLLIFLLHLQFLFAQNPPVANNDTFSINKNNQVTLPVLSNDFDIDGDSLTLSILLAPANGTATITGNQVTYVPNLNYVGSDSFTYVICDTANMCDTAMVSIIISGNNNYPVAVNDSFTVPETVASTLPLTSNDYDPDGEALSVTILLPPAHGTATISNNPSVTYTPTQFYFGLDSFIYIICDPGGLCDTATVYITVNGSNLSPLAVDDNFAFGDTLNSVSLDVLANDSDPENNSFAITAVLDIDSLNYLGSLSTGISGNLIFARNGITCGSETFAYIICDYSACDTGHVTISITCPENVFLPEGFSPDGDGINDKLVFTGLEYFAPAGLKVFNRYGTLVYENEDYRNDWAGTSLESNKALPDGTYFYILGLADQRKFNNYLIINR
jgi:gliding motility-associated-like protein